MCKEGVCGGTTDEPPGTTVTFCWFGLGRCAFRLRYALFADFIFKKNKDSF